MALVIDYGLQVENYPSFQINFSIPNNCDYTQLTDKKVHYITVALNKGQTVPSTVFTACSITLAAIDDVLDVCFEQVLNNATSSKPKFRVENN